MADLLRISQMPIQDIYEFVRYMKAFVDQYHDQACQILVQQPGLSVALLEAEIRLGMVRKPAQLDQGPGSAALDDTQKALIRQVQQLSSQDLQDLPGEQREQVIQLREAYGMPRI